MKWKAEAPLTGGASAFRNSGDPLYLSHEILYTCFETPHFRTDTLEAMTIMAMKGLNSFRV